MKILKIALIFFILVSNTALGEGDEEKLKAAKRYLATSPMSELMADMATNMALQLPPDKREDFVKLMTEEVDIDHIEKIALNAMVRTFTVEELNAFADFYGSDIGKSAMSKFGTYTSIVMPAVQQEMFRVIKKIESAKNLTSPITNAQ